MNNADPNRFEIRGTAIDGVAEVARKPLGDRRGFLERLYCQTDLETLMCGRRIEQVNRTLTEKKGTVRGLHFQRGSAAETKLISCLRGRVFDVAIDLRRASPTFLSSHALILDGAEHVSFLIPEGVAHGFQTLTDGCEMLYFHSAAHDPRAEGGIDPLDPAIGIDWPLPIAVMSDRDRNHPMISGNFEGL